MIITIIYNIYIYIYIIYYIYIYKSQTMCVFPFKKVVPLLYKGSPPPLTPRYVAARESVDQAPDLNVDVRRWMIQPLMMLDDDGNQHY